MELSSEVWNPFAVLVARLWAPWVSQCGLHFQTRLIASAVGCKDRRLYVAKAPIDTLADVGRAPAGVEEKEALGGESSWQKIQRSGVTEDWECSFPLPSKCGLPGRWRCIKYCNFRGLEARMHVAYLGDTGRIVAGLWERMRDVKENYQGQTIPPEHGLFVCDCENNVMNLKILIFCRYILKYL